jgi:hypothetical protein
MDFDEADRIFQTYKGAKNSVQLGLNIRLVQLASNRYGIQVFNTYALRIDQSGAYVISFDGEPSKEVLQVLRCLSPINPVKRRGQWLTQHGAALVNLQKSPLVVDVDGREFPSEQAA